MFVRDLGSTTELSVRTTAPYAAVIIGIIFGITSRCLGLVTTKTRDLLCKVLLQKTNKKFSFDC